MEARAIPGGTRSEFRRRRCGWRSSRRALGGVSSRRGGRTGIWRSGRWCCVPCRCGLREQLAVVLRGLWVAQERILGRVACPFRPVFLSTEAVKWMRGDQQRDAFVSPHAEACGDPEARHRGQEYCHPLAAAHVCRWQSKTDPSGSRNLTHPLPLGQPEAERIGNPNRTQENKSPPKVARATGSGSPGRSSLARSVPAPCAPACRA